MKEQQVASEPVPMIESGFPVFPDGIEDLESGQVLNSDQERTLISSIQLGLAVESSVKPKKRSREDTLLIDTGKRALQIFVEHNLKLVQFVIRRHFKYWGDLSREDLEQEGVIGLLRAVDKFKIDKEVRFATYAIWHIRRHISYAISSKSRTIHLPSRVVDRINEIDRANQKLLVSLGREPSLEELSQSMGCTPEEIQNLYTYRRSTISLDRPVGDGEGSLHNLVDSRLPSVDDELWEKSLPEELRKTLDCLNYDERYIVVMAYGLEGNNPISNIEIAKSLGLSSEKVATTLRRALAKLRHPSVGGHNLIELGEAEEWRNYAACSDQGLGHEFFKSTGSVKNKDGLAKIYVETVM